jgi:aminopeptidase N
VSATADAAALQGLLAEPPPGVTLDAELRWHVLRRLAALGALDDGQISAEQERDQTAAGQRHACYARAARPDADAKARAWDLVLHDTSLSNHQTEAYADGFWQHESAAATTSYVERYFTEIRAFWDERSPQVARRVAQSLYPSVQVEQAVVDRTDAFLADEDLPAGLRRVVLEQQDDLRRAVAARAVT